MNASQTVALHGLLQSICDGDQNAVARAGITTDNARRLMDLHATELLALIQTNTAFIQFKIDNAALNLLLQEIDRSRSRQQTAHALITSDAPLEMIRYFYPHIQRHHYGLQRRLSGLNSSPQGRTRSPDEEMELAISTAWFHQVEDQDNPTPEDYLNVHQTSTAPIRQIWAMYKPLDYGISR